MTEQHPPLSAVDMRFEDEIANLAHQYYQEEGQPEGRAQDHWLRAEQEVRARKATPPPPETEADRKTEEAMHLDK